MALEKDVILLELEKSRIEREKARIVLDKSIALYFIFMVVGIIGFAFEYIDSVLLNSLVIIGMLILILGTLPYLVITGREEKKINWLLEKAKGKK